MKHALLRLLETEKYCEDSIVKGLTTHKYSTDEELRNLLLGLKLENVRYDLNKKRKSVLVHSNFFIANYDKNVPVFKPFDRDLIKTSLNELKMEGLIYHEKRNNSYTLMGEDSFVAKVASTKKGILFFEHEGKMHFISKDEARGALYDDTVIIKKYKDEFSIHSIIKRGTSKLIAEVVLNNGIKEIKLLNVSEKYPLYLERHNYEKFNVGDRFTISLSDMKVNRRFVGKVGELICNKSDINSDYKSLCASYGFRFDFSDETKEEIKYLKDKVTESDLENRVDLRDKNIFTIDGIDAMDLDDAVSIERTKNGVILQVHIAHVSNYVKPDSAIYLDAFQNANSLYFPQSVNPMFPRELSNGICSLHEGVDRLTRTFEIHYNKLGEVVDMKNYKSVIRSKKKMNYDVINHYYRTGEYPEEYAPFIQDIEEMFTLSDKLTSQKLTRGYIGLENDELCFELDENNFPIAVNSRQVGKGQELIENFMIAANEAISVMAGTLPFPFRNHGFPDPEKLNETLKDIENIDLKLCSNLNGNSNQVLQVILESLKDKDNFIVISRLILFSLQKAYYSSNNIGHFGLALESYTHSTAPIRRIVDYWVHHLLDLYEEQNLTNEELNDLYVTVENICSHASLKERETDLLAYQVDKLEMAKYMSKRIGEGYKMFIQDIKKSHLIVRAKGLNEGIVKYNDFDGFAAKIKRKKMILGTDGYLYKIGDSLDVNVKSASIEDGKVYYKAKLPSYENEAVEVIRVRE